MPIINQWIAQHHQSIAVMGVGAGAGGPWPSLYFENFSKKRLFP